MDKYVDEQYIIDQVKMFVKIPNLRGSVFHKIKEWEKLFEKAIKEYHEIERIIDPGENKKVKPLEQKQISFQIEKIKGRWTVYPDLPKEIVNHIISQKVEPGIIKMDKLELTGRKIDLCFEKHSEILFTGSIKKKSTQVDSKPKETPSKQAGKADKKEDLKTLLAYLMENEVFYNFIDEQFQQFWKYYIDRDILKENVTES